MAWTHPAAAADADGGTVAIAALQDHYDGMVKIFNHGNFDSLNERMHADADAYAGAGAGASLTALPPDPGPTARLTQATGGILLNTRRSASSDSAATHAATSPDEHRRLATYGTQKKSTKRGGGAGPDSGLGLLSTFLSGQLTVFAVVALVAGVALAGRSAGSLLSGTSRGGLIRWNPRSGAPLLPRQSTPLLRARSTVAHSYGSTLHAPPSLNAPAGPAAAPAIPEM